MKPKLLKNGLCWVVLCALLSGGLASAATRYVWQESPSPTPPFTNWATAAQTIQEAVDAAEAGDEIVVTNGVYATGGRAYYGPMMTNRVMVIKRVVVRSVNGPEVTIIEGYQVPKYTNGPGAIRCAYLGNGAVLTGFTLTKGATASSNSSVPGESAGGGVFCDSFRGTVVSNCTITGNAAGYNGGGAYGGTLNNCVITGNTSSWLGGGAYISTLNNCTLTGNSARHGGGAGSCSLSNCILYYNTASNDGSNYSGGNLNYCCTSPLPTSGMGNISQEPQLASFSHLSATSPCRGAGSPDYATGTDIDGETWANPPSMGCDEYWSGSVTGLLTVAITATRTNVVAGYGIDFQALIEGRTSRSLWDFGDGVVVSNQPYVSHTWTAVGTYPMTLRAWNEDHPEGVSATLIVQVMGPVHYVAAESASPAFPFSSWSTAARTIQEAVDAAVAGNEIVVSNGVYATGGKAVWGALTNRVAVDKPVVVRSVNGPAVTIIEGFQVQKRTNDNGSIYYTNGTAVTRCVYLTNGAALIGFTLTKGETKIGGEPGWDNNWFGGGVWCASTSAVVSNCILTGNSAHAYGGGAFGGTLNHCTLIGNSAGWSGGGAYRSTLNNCTIISNWASRIGGGVYEGVLNNCTLTGNSAFSYGGGAGLATLNHCTLTGNKASYGGGSSASALTNCIVYYNTATIRDPNCLNSTLHHSCTTPLPTNGVGNITLEPQLASASHLSAASPCRNTGFSIDPAGTDIDGEAWANPPSIGCDEYWEGSATGPLSVGLTATLTNTAAGYAVDFRALIDGRTSGSAWDFGDGVVESNRPYASHTWTTNGTYPVTLRAWNEDHPEGVSATLTVHVIGPLHYVSATSTSPAWPFTSWATAARTIQEAVDAAPPGNEIVVSNGLYATGGRAVYRSLTNRVAVDKPVRLRSVNGPEVTIIQGYQVPGTTIGDEAIRCVYLAAGAVLSGFTLTNGATRNLVENYTEMSGGGVLCASTNAVVSNCLFRGNSAFTGGGSSSGTLNHCTFIGNSATWGGGAQAGRLNHCIFIGNTAKFGNGPHLGGGANASTLNHCTLTGNSADNGGGASASTLNNCILFYNTAYTDANHANSTLNYCCTTPLPTSGMGNITNEPVFVNLSGGNLRLQSNSPCINAGNNYYMSGQTDRDGMPRIAGVTVDMGAYEFQAPASALSYAWLQQYGLALDGSADLLDADHDGLTNAQEWQCGTDPTNALSVLRVLAPVRMGNEVRISWPSVAAVYYVLERSTNLAGSPAFEPVATNLPGQAGTTTYTDTNIVNAPQLFYRVRVAP